MTDALNLRSSLKKTILELIEDMKENIFTDTREKYDMEALSCFFNTLISEADLMELVIKNILPHSKYIMDRNKTFFIQNQSLFSGLPKDRIIYYTNVITNNLSQEDESALFDYFIIIVKIAEKYRNSL